MLATSGLCFFLVDIQHCYGSLVAQIWPPKCHHSMLYVGQMKVPKVLGVGCIWATVNLLSGWILKSGWWGSSDLPSRKSDFRGRSSWNFRLGTLKICLLSTNGIHYNSSQPSSVLRSHNLQPQNSLHTPFTLRSKTPDWTFGLRQVNCFSDLWRSRKYDLP